MLGAAVGWQLTKRKIKFAASISLSDTELDFVLDTTSGKALIECKMYHLLGADDTLARKLSEGERQLRAHVAVAKERGMTFAHAACVVNVPRRRLARMTGRLQATPDRQWPDAKGVLTSYENLRSYLDSILGTARATRTASVTLILSGLSGKPEKGRRWRFLCHRSYHSPARITQDSGLM